MTRRLFHNRISHSARFGRLRGGRHRCGATELLVAAIAVVLLAGLGGSVWWMLRDTSDADRVATPLHEVTRDSFVLTITEHGDIRSSEDVEVRCEVKSKGASGGGGSGGSGGSRGSGASGGTTILSLVEEGTLVQPGDFIAQLDSSALEEERVLQQLAVNAAAAIMVETKSTFETAEIALKEYMEGTFIQEQKTIENEIFVAKENLSRAKEYLLYSERLAVKGHITDQQLEADKFAVEKAETEEALAETKLRVLEEYTKAKQFKTLGAAIATAKAKWDSATKTYRLETEKLNIIDAQIAKCTVRAPSVGTVVYAHEERRGDDVVIEAGLGVREGQPIVRLPNPDKMQVVLMVNEALVKYVAPGFKAAVKPVGFETPLAGTVTQVNQYAEPQHWRQPNARQYRTIVRIDETHPDLRTGMTALATIECSRLPDVVRVPVQAVYAHGSQFYCFVQKDGQWEARLIQRGPTSDRLVVIEDGLDVGEQIALTPRVVRDLVSLPKLSPEESQNIVPSVELPGGPSG